MNAIAHREATVSRNPFDPFGIGQATAGILLTSTQIMIDAFAQAACAVTLHSDLSRAKAEAERLDRIGDQIAPLNFGIVSTNINGTILPVETSYKEISPTCNLHNIHCPGRIPSHRDIVISASNSGARASVFSPLISHLLPHANIYITEWVPPQNIPLFHPQTGQRITFGLEDQTDDTMKCFVQIGQNAQKGFDVIAVSGGGTNATIGIGVIAQEPEKYRGGLPVNVILAGTPSNPHRDRSFMNWIAANDLEEGQLVSKVGPRFIGCGREIVSTQSLHAIARCTTDVLSEHKHEQQALDAQYVRETHRWIFQQNLLAKGQYLHRGKKLDFTRANVGLMKIVAEDDGFVPPGQTKAADDIFTHATHRKLLVLRRDIHEPTKKVGHYALINPGRPLEHMATEILRFTQG